MIYATTCVAEVPCEAGRLSDMMGKRCMLGNIIFTPFTGDLNLPADYEYLYFEPEAADPTNPGFTISRPRGLSITPPLLSVDSTYDPAFGLTNDEWVFFGYNAELPCTGAICETAFAPVITAVAVVATNYSVDLG